jgi:hypothetical protein
MATGASTRSLASSQPSTLGEFSPPAYALREMPPVSELPKDELGREIPVLLIEHPEIAAHLGDLKLDVSSGEEKEKILAVIKDMLGIRPIRRRHLGYVGP